MPAQLMRIARKKRRPSAALLRTRGLRIDTNDITAKVTTNKRKPNVMTQDSVSSSLILRSVKVLFLDNVTCKAATLASSTIHTRMLRKEAARSRRRENCWPGAWRKGESLFCVGEGGSGGD
jgi:hypothetical protein